MSRSFTTREINGVLYTQEDGDFHFGTFIVAVIMIAIVLFFLQSGDQDSSNSGLDECPPTATSYEDCR